MRGEGRKGIAQEGEMRHERRGDMRRGDKGKSMEDKYGETRGEVSGERGEHRENK